ncbi:11195_t:CDS:2, partial [Racocetra persica]
FLDEQMIVLHVQHSIKVIDKSALLLRDVRKNCTYVYLPATAARARLLLASNHAIKCIILQKASDTNTKHASMYCRISSDTSVVD